MAATVPRLGFFGGEHTSLMKTGVSDSMNLTNEPPSLLPTSVRVGRRTFAPARA